MNASLNLFAPPRTSLFPSLLESHQHQNYFSVERRVEANEADEKKVLKVNKTMHLPSSSFVHSFSFLCVHRFSISNSKQAAIRSFVQIQIYSLGSLPLKQFPMQAEMRWMEKQKPHAIPVTCYFY